MTSLAESAHARNKKENRSTELRQRIDANLEALAKAVDDVRASQEFVRFLDVQSKFHHYSWHNTLLIASQRPDATQVAGYRAWQKLGRHVRKGERGIAIFAPMTFKRDARETETETDENGKIAITSFRVVHVFDVAQTDGEALPTVDVPNLDMAADSLLSDLQRIATNRGIVVEFKALRAGHYGTSKKGAIELATGQSTGSSAKTLAHELAHEALHWEDRGELTRTIAELEAESVAYVVCSHFSLDVEVRASKYIALWGGDSKSLKASLKRISETARAMIDEAEALNTQRAVA